MAAFKEIQTQTESPIVDAVNRLTAVTEQQPKLIAEALSDALQHLTPRHEIVREVVVSGVESGNYQHFPPVLELSERKAASPKLKLAIQWLLDHPEDHSLSDRKLAEKLGLSHPWIGKARKLIANNEYQAIL